MLQHAISSLAPLKNKHGLIEVFREFRDQDLLRYLKQELPEDMYKKFVDAILNRQFFKRIGAASWSDLENHGFHFAEIQDLIAEHQSPISMQSYVEGLVDEVRQQKNQPTIGVDDVLVDIPLLVGKSVSHLEVRIRNQNNPLVQMKDLSISAIGPYMERAYQLIWKIQLFGASTLSKSSVGLLKVSWNKKYPKLAFR
jgi:hypothetical protein